MKLGNFASACQFCGIQKLTLSGLHDQSETGRDGLAGLLSLNHFEGLGGVVGGWEVEVVVKRMVAKKIKSSRGSHKNFSFRTKRESPPLPHRLT